MYLILTSLNVFCLSRKFPIFIEYKGNKCERNRILVEGSPFSKGLWLHQEIIRLKMPPKQNSFIRFETHSNHGHLADARAEYEVSRRLQLDYNWRRNSVVASIQRRYLTLLRDTLNRSNTHPKIPTSEFLAFAWQKAVYWKIQLIKLFKKIYDISLY